MRPKHYVDGVMEPIKLIRKYELGFESGNALKYIARCEQKGNKLEDLKKALHYIQMRIDHRNGETYASDLQEAWGVNQNLAMAAYYILAGADYAAKDNIMKEIAKLENEQTDGETTA